MVAYGGAGPLHAAMIARELRIGEVIIPYAPGHFSAYGMLFADLRRDLVNTWFKPFAEASFEEMEALYAAMETAGRRGPRAQPRHDGRDGGAARRRHALCRPGARGDRRHLRWTCSRAQDRAGIKKHFDAVHETRYGYSNADEKAEIVSSAVGHHRLDAQAADGACARR